MRAVAAVVLLHIISMMMLIAVRGVWIAVLIPLIAVMVLSFDFVVMCWRIMHAFSVHLSILASDWHLRSQQQQAEHACHEQEANRGAHGGCETRVE
jgi:hypothetical protein